MITTGLLSLLYLTILVITSPLRLLPDVSLPAGIASAITTANSYISALNFVAPIDTILIIIGLVISVEGGIIVWKIINWLIRKIPTIS